MFVLSMAAAVTDMIVAAATKLDTLREQLPLTSRGGERERVEDEENFA